MKIHIQSPNFKKTLSREQVDKVKDKKILILRPIKPLYNLVFERSISMAKYFEEKKKQTSIRNDTFSGFDSHIFYNPSNHIDKINNHKGTQAVNFGLMTARKNEKNNPLPSYMFGVHDGNAAYAITEKSIKMNCFAEGKLKTPSTMFFPKKSFNNIINLNIISSKNLNEAKNDEEIKNKMNFVKKGTNLNNVEMLIKQGELTKFDGTTYKRKKRKKNKIL